MSHQPAGVPFPLQLRLVCRGTSFIRRRSPIRPYRGTSLIRNRRPLGPYSRTMPRALWGSWGGGRFLMSEVPLYSRVLRWSQGGGWLLTSQASLRVDSLLTTIHTAARKIAPRHTLSVGPYCGSYFSYSRGIPALWDHHRALDRPMLLLNATLCHPA